MLAYNRRLDTLRAVAVSLVLVAHWVPLDHRLNATANGQTGVYLFFVLSGYLITSILLSFRASIEAGERSARAALGAFYARRALRIFPLYYLSLLVVWAVPDLTQTSIRTAWSWYALFAQNLFMLLLGRTDGLLTHFWSLAVEEQFYVFWGAAVLFLPRRSLVPIATAAVALAPLVRWLGFAVIGLDEHPLTLWYFQTPSCVDGLGLGALVALGRGGSGRLEATLRRWSGRLALPGLAIELCYRALPAAWWLAGHFLVAWLSVRVLFWAIDGLPGRFAWLDRALESRAVVALGRRSYALYLIHGFVPYFLVSVENMLRARGIDQPWLSALFDDPLRRLVWVVLNTALAFCSWSLVEQPFNSLKDRFFADHRRPARAA